MSAYTYVCNDDSQTYTCSSLNRTSTNQILWTHDQEFGEGGAHAFFCLQDRGQLTQNKGCVSQI